MICFANCEIPCLSTDLFLLFRPEIFFVTAPLRFRVIADLRNRDRVKYSNTFMTRPGEQAKADLRNQVAAGVKARNASQVYVSITGGQHSPVVGEVKSKWNLLPV